MTVGAALGGHAAHFVVFGTPIAVLVGTVGVQELRARRRARPDGEPRESFSPGEVSLAVAAAGLIVSAAIHVAVAPEHFREYVAYGIFFSLLAIAQVTLAVKLLLAPPRHLVRAIAVASGAVVMLWLASRTTGLPIGPERWDPERVGVLDIAASTAEIITLFACLAALTMGGRRVRATRRTPGLIR